MRVFGQSEPTTSRVRPSILIVPQSCDGFARSTVSARWNKRKRVVALAILSRWRVCCFNEKSSGVKVVGNSKVMRTNSVAAYIEDRPCTALAKQYVLLHEDYKPSWLEIAKTGDLSIGRVATFMVNRCHSAKFLTYTFLLTERCNTITTISCASRSSIPNGSLTANRVCSIVAHKLLGVS